MPKKEKVYTVHLRLLITPELDTLLERASILDHRKKPDFIRHYMELASKQVINQHAQFEVIQNAGDVYEMLKDHK